MSFLAEENAHETLQEALAFIDACGEDGTMDSTDDSSSSSRSQGISTTSSSSDIPVSTSITSGRSVKRTVTTDAGDQDDGEEDGCDASPFSGASSVQRHKQLQSAKQAARARKLQNAAVRRSRAKKQAENILLREELAQLETRLSELQDARRSDNPLLQVYVQRMRRDSDTSEDEPTSPSWQAYLSIEDGDRDGDDSSLASGNQSTSATFFWLDLAVKQARERRKSQSLNAKLKEAVSRQAKLAKSLEAIFAKMSSQAFQYESSLLAQKTGIMTDLQLRAHQMHVEVDSLFAHPSWLQIADSVGCSDSIKQDPAFGPVVELRMNISLCCGVHELGDTLWKRTMETSALVQTPNYFFERRMLTRSSYQKCYTIILNTSKGLLELTATSYVERFSDTDYDSFIWASAIFSPNEGEVFREKGGMVASNPAARGSQFLQDTSAPKSLFQGHYEVFCDDSREDEKMRSFESKDQRDLVLRTLSNRMRNFHQCTQSLLLDEFAGSEMSVHFKLLRGSES